jgi:Uncharacterized conserved protein
MSGALGLTKDAGGTAIEPLTERFITSAQAAAAVVTTTTPQAVALTLGELLAGESLVLVAADHSHLVPELQARGVRASVGTREAVGSLPSGSSLEQAFRDAGAAVTGSLVAVAASGSVAVGPSGGNGGLLSALPPRHVVLVHEEDIRASLAEALAFVAERFTELGGEVVFVTGPSRTADIEMLSVLGVHGPIRLDVVVIAEGGD